MLAIDGATTTEIAVGLDPVVNVIVAVADFDASSTAVAISVTVGGFGTAAGAVYVTGTPDPDVAPDKVPQAAPMQPAPESAHVVPLFFGSSVTLALKVAVLLACTVAEPGANVTAMLSTGAGLVEDPPPHPENPASPIIMHKPIAATSVRSTPRKKGIHPPEKAIGDGSGILARTYFRNMSEHIITGRSRAEQSNSVSLDALGHPMFSLIHRKPIPAEWLVL